MPLRGGGMNAQPPPPPPPKRTTGGSAGQVSGQGSHELGQECAGRDPDGALLLEAISPDER